MNNPNHSQPQLFRELEEVLAEYLQDAEAGISVDAEALAEAVLHHRRAALVIARPIGHPGLRLALGDATFLKAPLAHRFQAGFHRFGTGIHRQPRRR